MFDKYGEFDSAEELNLAAEGFAGEGDTEALFGLAAENGIEREEAQDYLDGYKDELASDYEAAMGRLSVQSDEKISVLISLAMGMCGENRDFCRSVMKKGKRVQKAFDALKDAARKEARKRIASGETMASVCETDREKEMLLMSYFTQDEGGFAGTVDQIVKGGAYERI